MHPIVEDAKGTVAFVYSRERGQPEGVAGLAPLGVGQGDVETHAHGTLEPCLQLLGVVLALRGEQDVGVAFFLLSRVVRSVGLVGRDEAVCSRQR